MTEDDVDGPDYEILYYLLDDQTVGRIWYDVDAGERFDGEVLATRGTWQEFPIDQILAHGEEIEFNEAQQRVAALGGTM